MIDIALINIQCKLNIDSEIFYYALIIIGSIYSTIAKHFCNCAIKFYLKFALFIMLNKTVNAVIMISG